MGIYVCAGAGTGEVTLASCFCVLVLWHVCSETLDSRGDSMAQFSSPHLVLSIMVIFVGLCRGRTNTSLPVSLIPRIPIYWLANKQWECGVQQGNYATQKTKTPPLHPTLILTLFPLEVFPSKQTYM